VKGFQEVEMLGRMNLVARQLAEMLGVQHSGYRIVINTGPVAGQSIFHLHLHLLGGRSLPFNLQ
jgi:histidine triad (HIT) family protein